MRLLLTVFIALISSSLAHGNFLRKRDKYKQRLKENIIGSTIDSDRSNGLDEGSGGDDDNVNEQKYNKIIKKLNMKMKLKEDIISSMKIFGGGQVKDNDYESRNGYANREYRDRDYLGDNRRTYREDEGNYMQNVDSKIKSNIVVFGGAQDNDEDRLRNDYIGREYRDRDYRDERRAYNDEDKNNYKQGVHSQIKSNIVVFGGGQDSGDNDYIGHENRDRDYRDDRRTYENDDNYKQNLKSEIKNDIKSNMIIIGGRQDKDEDRSRNDFIGREYRDRDYRDDRRAYNDDYESRYGRGDRQAYRENEGNYMQNVDSNIKSDIIIFGGGQDKDEDRSRNDFIGREYRDRDYRDDRRAYNNDNYESRNGYAGREYRDRDYPRNDWRPYRENDDYNNKQNLKSRIKSDIMSNMRVFGGNDDDQPRQDYRSNWENRGFGNDRSDSVMDRMRNIKDLQNGRNDDRSIKSGSYTFIKIG